MIQEVDRQVQYLALPMLLSAHYGRFRIGAGYQLAVPLIESGTYCTYPYANGLGSYTTFNTEELGLLGTDMGVVVEAGSRVTDRWELGARYYHGFQDIKDHRDGYLSPLMNQQVLVTISFRILPWRGQKVDPTPAAPIPTGSPNNG